MTNRTRQPNLLRSRGLTLGGRVAGAIGINKRHPLGNFIAWFFFVTMILGEPVHLLVFPFMVGGGTTTSTSLEYGRRCCRCRPPSLASGACSRTSGQRQKWSNGEGERENAAALSRPVHRFRRDGRRSRERPGT
jgi:hypothetical protein